MQTQIGKIGRRVASAWTKRKAKKAARGNRVARMLGLPKLGARFARLKKDATVSRVMDREVRGALRHMVARNPGLAEQLDKAYGYAVFPDIGKATLVLGGSYGTGQVFERGKLVGYARAVQITIGVQVGGQTCHELVVFETREALESFKRGRIGFAANASAALVSVGAAATASKTGMRAFLQSEGGMMVEAAIGGQKFTFKPAASGPLGRRAFGSGRHPAAEAISTVH